MGKSRVKAQKKYAELLAEKRKGGYKDIAVEKSKLTVFTDYASSLAPAVDP